eukprot:6433975-Prymnesium_polylepis.1
MAFGPCPGQRRNRLTSRWSYPHTPPAMSVTVCWPDVDSDYANELTSDQAKRYTIAPEELATTGRVLQSFICSGIASRRSPPAN